ncbi:caspase-1-like isoform X3 [Anas acuta]|uniref:caspase-1-like isoform X3 n=1 Tax=Anas acuta TaxID=28680 RepID=UPI0035C886C1
MSERNASPPSAEPAAGPRPSARPPAYPVTGRGARGGAGRGARRPMRNHSASRRGQSARGQAFTSGRAALGPWGLGGPGAAAASARPGGCCRGRGPPEPRGGAGLRAGPWAGPWGYQELLKVRADFVERVRKPLISKLLDDLLAHKVLSQGEVDEVQEGYAVTGDKARCLIDAVRLKGSKASQIFIDSLRKHDHTLVEQLGLATGSGSPGVQPPVSIQGQQWIRQCSLSEYQRIQEAEGNQIYPILLPRETRTRRALLICNTEFEHLSQREGAEVDVKEMMKLLEGLGYRVDLHENLTSQEMAMVMKDFAGHKDHLTSDSTFLVFMSHGRRTGLCGTKSRDETTDILSLGTIYENFNNKHCKALIGKPKVVIIQSCRGDTVSWRSPVTGSIFIQRLVEQFRNHAFNSDLQELFRKVQRSFEDFPKQLPTQERTTMLRKFYLFPGH